MKSFFYKGYRIDYTSKGAEVWTGYDPRHFDNKLVELFRGRNAVAKAKLFIDAA